MGEDVLELVNIYTVFVCVYSGAINLGVSGDESSRWMDPGER